MTEPVRSAVPARDRQSPGARDLAGAVVIVVAVSRLVDPPVAALMAVLLFGAIALGGLQVIAEGDPVGEGVGIPVEALIAPALAALAAVGLVRLVPVGVLLVPAVAGLAWLVMRIAAVEGRIARATVAPRAADRTATQVVTLVVGFLAFVAVAALVPGGLPEPGAGSGADAAVRLAGADALVGLFIGYRTAALRSSDAREAAWFGLTTALVVGIAAASLRTLGIPRLLGPALLALVSFLWDAVHGGPAGRRRDVRLIWETVLLAVLGVVVVAWSLGAGT